MEFKLLALLSFFCVACAKRGPPHIVYILVDDMGYNDIGYNNPQVHTPRIDDLAEQGMILSANYMMPQCSPSRAALLTGRAPHRIMMGHDVLTPYQPHCIPTNIDLISNIFQDNGYQTHLAGKWHAGYCKEACIPNNRGFDSFHGMFQGMGTFWNHTIRWNFDWWKDTEADWSAWGTYATDLIGARIVEVINQHQDGDPPIFAMATFNAPHTPLEAPEEFIALYDKYCGMSMIRKTYLGMMSSVDVQVGLIEAALRQKGMWGNTFIAFASDNGGEHGGQSSNLPYRSGKASMYEGGTRTAAFVSGGLVEDQGNTHDGLFHVTDWLPTLASIAGINIDTTVLDGIDQSDMVVKGKASQRNEILYNLDMQREKTAGVSFWFGGNAGIRLGDMKMIWGYPGLIDGYGEDLVPFYENDEYLSLIGKAGFVYPPYQRAHQYDKSPEEIENAVAILDIIGIYNVTRDNMDNIGRLEVYNLADDPEERTNLAESTDCPIVTFIAEAKDRIMTLLETEYVQPQAASYTPDYRVLRDPSYTWAVGYCENTTIHL